MSEKSWKLDECFLDLESNAWLTEKRNSISSSKMDRVGGQTPAGPCSVSNPLSAESGALLCFQPTGIWPHNNAVVSLQNHYSKKITIPLFKPKIQGFH